MRSFLMIGLSAAALAAIPAQAQTVPPDLSGVAYIAHQTNDQVFLLVGEPRQFGAGRSTVFGTLVHVYRRPQISRATVEVATFFRIDTALEYDCVGSRQRKIAAATRDAAGGLIRIEGSGDWIDLPPASVGAKALQLACGQSDAASVPNFPVGQLNQTVQAWRAASRDQ